MARRLTLSDGALAAVLMGAGLLVAAAGAALAWGLGLGLVVLGVGMAGVALLIGWR